MVRKVREETKGQFCKRVGLANVPSFRFWYHRSILKCCTLVPVFGIRCSIFVPSFQFWGSREHPPKPPFCRKVAEQNSTNSLEARSTLACKLLGKESGTEPNCRQAPKKGRGFAKQVTLSPYQKIREPGLLWFELPHRLLKDSWSHKSTHSRPNMGKPDRLTTTMMRCWAPTKHRKTPRPGVIRAVGGRVLLLRVSMFSSIPLSWLQIVQGPLSSSRVSGRISYNSELKSFSENILRGSQPLPRWLCQTFPTCYAMTLLTYCDCYCAHKTVNQGLNGWLAVWIYCSQKRLPRAWHRATLKLENTKKKSTKNKIPHPVLDDTKDRKNMKIVMFQSFCIFLGPSSGVDSLLLWFLFCFRVSGFLGSVPWPTGS